MTLLGSYVCYTTNTLDTVKAFIAETYVQLAATKSKCYSTSCECATVDLTALLSCVRVSFCTVLYDGLNSYSCRH